DHDGEADRRIQIPLGYMQAHAFGDQAEADHQQEAQAQDDQRRVGIDEAGQTLAGQQHDNHGHDHGNRHHRQFIGHADGGNDRVDREHGVQDHDLGDHHAKAGVGQSGAAGVLAALEALMQLHGGLEQQEQAARQHDQVPGRHGVIADVEQRVGQGDQPGDTHQQDQAHDQGQGQAQHARLVTLVRRQFLRQYGNEYQVVDAQDDFQGNQRKQARPDSRISQPLKHGWAPLRSDAA